MNTVVNSTSLPVKAGRAQAALWHKPLQALLQKLLARMRHGTLHIQLPEGGVLTGQGTLPGPEATIVLHRWSALVRLLTRGDIGLAQAYIEGAWSTPNLTPLLSLGILNEAAWDRELSANRFMRAFFRLAHLFRDNTRSGSRRNISFHYDLGNDFYAQWLDSTMLYSSGIYSNESDTLEASQERKLQRIAELLQLHEPAMQVLEIGCGWGALACHLAQENKAQMTGITLSKEQLAFAQSKVQALSLEQQVELRLQDYRDTSQTYDRIVSIEMIEAVGEKHWPTYFQTLFDRLKPGGRAVIQAITIHPDQFDRYRSQADFIQHHIFPGGMLPTEAIMASQAQQAGLTPVEQETFGMSYAHTLVEWRHRFKQAWPQIAAQGFDERFRRLWEYYLCYCEAGFIQNRVNVGLYVFEKKVTKV